MKRVYKIVISLLLAALIFTLMPAQIFADSLTEYISEVKVFYGSYAEAEKEGYTVLKDSKGNPVDVNQGAGGGWGSSGEKAVYLCYKTTTDRDEAITDLAVMNMKGGYSTEDYEYLMEYQMNSQIIPYVDNFLETINEYRENYKSANSENRQRAQFIHDALNLFTDDDCDGAGLGDLFLNETVYEMARGKYDALSEEEKEKTSLIKVNEQTRDSLPENEKNKHADILTILAQSNGRIMLMTENLLTRAADTTDSTWLERFSKTTYEDLENSMDLPPSEAGKKLAKLYDDDAQTILGMWDSFRNVLLDYDKNVEIAESFDADEAEKAAEAVENVDENASDDEIADVVIDYVSQQVDNLDFIDRAQHAVIHDVLAGIDYMDGSMLDFFSMTSEELEDDITLLYPLVASLTAGQKASLDYLTLKDLFAAALTTAEGYKEIDLSKYEETSVYADVDRGIYEKGGVALTSDALRTDAMSRVNEDNETRFSDSTIAMMIVTAFTALGSLISTVGYISLKLDVYTLKVGSSLVGEGSQYSAKTVARLLAGHKGITKALQTARRNGEQLSVAAKRFSNQYAERMAPKHALFGKLAIGFSIVMVLVAGYTTYLAWEDLKAYYKVDFSPVPRYMIDEKDLLGYNSRGEKVVLKNQSAYYKLVQSNAKSGDFKYDEIGSSADLNGCVGKQWLALYANKNEMLNPIIASSFVAVVGSPEIPSGYTTGIHMFGSDAAFNLNSSLYIWNSTAASVFVYYQTDDSKTSTTGTNVSGGTLALTGGAGLALGAVVSALVMKPKKKKTEE